MNLIKNGFLIVGIIVMVSLSVQLIIPVEAKPLSPYAQLRQGISIEEITCQPGMDLVMLTSERPACVKPTSSEKLEKLGLVVKVIAKAMVAVDFDAQKESEVRISDAPVSRDVEIRNAPLPGEVDIGNISEPDYVRQPTDVKSEKVVPASSGSIVNFYVVDDDLNVSHRGVDVVSTAGLIEFTINGIPVGGPKTMIETDIDSGKFYVKLELPDTINGKPLGQNDIVVMKYLDASDVSGDRNVVSQTVSLAKTYAQVQVAFGGDRIGRDFIVRLYEPDANRDSKDVDKISLSNFEFRGEGGIRTLLSNPAFDANANYLYETGPNSNIFEVTIKIPRTIDGKVVHIGDSYEIRYYDRSTPSGTIEKIIMQGRIG